jgi:uncharacterized protein
VKIAISNIPEDGLSLEFTRDANWFYDSLKEAEKKDFQIQNAEIKCSIKSARESFYVEGSIKTMIQVECCRCLTELKIPIQSDFKYTFSPAEEKQLEEVELNSEDLDCASYRDDFIDLDPIVYEQIVLHIPVKALCAESCKGLCPHCGANLNNETCNCREKITDSRLAVLKNFKVKKT